MKWLFVMDSLGTGGAERSNADFWYYLQAEQVPFEVVVLRHRHEGVEEEVLASGIKVHFLEPGSLWTQVTQLSKIINTYEPDLVHSVLFNSNLRTRLAKARHGGFVHVESLVNTTYDAHRLDDPAVTWWKLRAYQGLDAVTARFYTDYFHAITETVARHYRQQLRLPAQSMRVIPRGRFPNEYRNDAALRRHYRQRLGIGEDELVIISTGRQEYQKGHTDYLDALHLLQQERGFSNFRYLLLGRDGQMTPELTQKIVTYDLEDQVLRLGHRSDVAQLLACGDLYAFPSRYEGLGVSLIEAQAAGLPIVCSDIPVFHEVTRPGENALLVAPGDATGFAEATWQLATQPALRERFSEVSLQNFNEKFNLDTVHRQMLDYFTEIATEA